MAYSEGSKPLCGAKRRGEGAGLLCTQFAGWGTDHPGSGPCKFHFGNARVNKVKANVAALQERANKVLGKLKIDPVEDPLTELSRIAGETVAWKDVIAEQVSFLKGVSYESERNGEQVRGEIIVWERALDRCIVVLTGMARLDIDDRLAKVSEKQAEMVEQALDFALRSTGLSVAQRAEAKRCVAERLRLVSGG